MGSPQWFPPVLLDLLGQLHLQGESLHGSHGNWQQLAAPFFAGRKQGGTAPCEPEAIVVVVTSSAAMRL